MSRPIYVNVDTPNLGFPYFFRGVPVEKLPVRQRGFEINAKKFLDKDVTLQCTGHWSHDATL